MICDWLANQEYLFPWESSNKIDVFRVKKKKRSNVHIKDNRISKEISPTKASLTKKLSTVERLHLPDTLYSVSQIQQKVTIYIYIYCNTIVFQ